MADYPNSGALFRNDDKKTENHPDFGGSLDAVTCPHCHQESDYWLSGWIKTAKSTGRRFFSLSVKPKEQAQPKQSKPAAPPPVPADDFDDDLPF